MDLLLASSASLLAIALIARRRRASPRAADACPHEGARDEEGAEQLATLATRHQVMEDIQSHFEGRHVDET